MIRAWFVLVAALLAAAPAADATFPGRNGGFAVTAPGCEENQHIQLLSEAGRTLRDLTPRCERVGEDAFLDTLGPSWAPNGGRLAYVRRVFGGPLEIASLPLDGGPVSHFGPPYGPRGGDQGPTYSPEGDRLAYEYNGTLYTAAIDGSEHREVHGGRPFYTRPRWSPDGRTLLVERPSRSALVLVDAQGGHWLRRIARGAHEADWSPDGRWIVFRTRYRQDEIEGGASGGNLYVVRADRRRGSRPRRIVHRERTAETSPVFSPDGRWIAWVSLRFTAGDVGFRVYPSLWRMRFPGGRPQRLRFLPQPFVEEAFFSAPQIAWRPIA